ncbi:hypothetical protein ACHAXA_003673 [Cyclostephanos tholiformis]|uniref:Uncharacterized protein n=1 Tax=Cyclostephanos tholiformis TaxID=382380 RepID=A0ABD3SP53_9STRA
MDEAELAGLVNLEELWLGKNKIERISSLLELTKLHRLDVQSDRLTRVEGLEAQVHLLEVLYLSHNGIDDEGASYEGGLSLMFENLNTINMSRNRLTSTRPFGHLTSLVDLWISGNDIKTFDDLYLEYNPLDKEFEYRKRLAEMIPLLTQIDANKIGGLAAYGWGGIGGGGFGSMGDPMERMRQMQDMAIRRAEMESQKNRYLEEKDAPEEASSKEER